MDYRFFIDLKFVWIMNFYGLRILKDMDFGMDMDLFFKIHPDPLIMRVVCLEEKYVNTGHITT